MKKIFLIIISLFMIILLGLNIYEYKKHRDISIKYNNLLNDSDYESKINNLTDEIDRYVDLISNKYNLEYKNSSDIIKLQND